MALPPSKSSVIYAREQLALWQDALTAASSGQSYSIGGRTLTRQDIREIRNEIQRWDQTVKAQESLLKGFQRPLGATALWGPPGGAGYAYSGGFYTGARKR